MPKSADRREARRIPVVVTDNTAKVSRLENVTLPARIFLPATETEIACTVTWLSPEGASIDVTERFEVSQELVLYIEGFDRFSATVVRKSPVRVTFNGSPMKRERTAAKIDAYARGTEVEQSTLRNAAALASQRTFRRTNGLPVDFEVIDISLLGASLRTRARPPIGEIVMIGTTEGRVARYLDDGIAIEFVRPKPRNQEPDEQLP